MPSKPLVKAKTLAEQQKDKQKAGPSINLINPVSQHFGAFIVGNAAQCDAVVEENSHAGQHAVICGAGPSLAEDAAEWVPQADVVIGCNSALTWLIDHGYQPTHGFCIDQQAEMIAEWASAPDVEYLVASTVHPHLVEYLLGKGRRLRFFHNFVGIQQRPVAYALCEACGNGDNPMDAPACAQCGGQMLQRHEMSYEDYLYVTLYPGTVRAGAGLNSVTRAIDVARFMGFSQITVLGADCALRVKRPCPNVPMGSPDHLAWLRDETIMHADGGNALASNATPVTMQAEIDSGTPDARIRKGHGTWWVTKPDMMLSAVWLTQMAKAHPELRLIGNTLPNALKGKNDAYMERLPGFPDINGRNVRYDPAMEV